MNNYLTIGEFAKLRGVNINSLLYYEKLGILLPAYTDPHSRYRYYAPEQLSTLDIILLCINLDIPLKDLKKYQDENAYWQKKMLEDGKRIAEDKIRRMQNDLRKIESSLKCQEEQHRYAGCDGIYQREIASRFYIVEEYFGELANITHFGKISTHLFDYAENKGFSTVLPSGYMFAFNDGEVRQFLFYEVLPAGKKDEKIIEIPKGIYSCLQIKFEPDMDHIHFLEHHFGSSDKRLAIVSNLIRDKLQINSRYNEIQVIDGYTIPDSRR
ncbi:MAG: MerR family DNA-binding transcriptional regulator [Clostridiales bacterium]|nr:MerR family DNA-binding transcriptional regulator [Clostridiales bacterium]